MENTLRYLTEKEVSDMTRIALPTLRNQRSQGIGIPYSKIGRSVRYSLDDVVAYMGKYKIATVMVSTLQEINP
ncbi:MAG: DNA-binding protein [Candidatus Zixiibacteriota bacterium]|nr:MAG: DNA-binding protein [candidate division Zixibacteria bacterium]